MPRFPFNNPKRDNLTMFFIDTLAAANDDSDHFTIRQYFTTPLVQILSQRSHPRVPNARQGANDAPKEPDNVNKPICENDEIPTAMQNCINILEADPDTDSWNIERLLTTGDWPTNIAHGDLRTEFQSLYVCGWPAYWVLIQTDAHRAAIRQFLPTFYSGVQADNHTVMDYFTLGNRGAWDQEQHQLFKTARDLGVIGCYTRNRAVEPEFLFKSVKPADGPEPVNNGYCWCPRLATPDCVPNSGLHCEGDTAASDECPVGGNCP